MPRGDGLPLLVNVLENKHQRVERQKDRQFELQRLNAELEARNAQNNLRAQEIQLGIAETRLRAEQLRADIKDKEDQRGMRFVENALRLSEMSGAMYAKNTARYDEAVAGVNTTASQFKSSLITEYEDKDGNKLAQFNDPLTRHAHSMANQGGFGITMEAMAGELHDVAHTAYERTIKEGGSDVDAGIAARRAMTEQTLFIAANGVPSLAGAQRLMSSGNAEERKIGLAEIVSHFKRTKDGVKFFKNKTSDVNRLSVEGAIDEISSGFWDSNGLDGMLSMSMQYQERADKARAAAKQASRLHDYGLSAAAEYTSNGKRLSFSDYQAIDGEDVEKGLTPEDIMKNDPRKRATEAEASAVEEQDTYAREILSTEASLRVKRKELAGMRKDMPTQPATLLGSPGPAMGLHMAMKSGKPREMSRIESEIKELEGRLDSLRAGQSRSAARRELRSTLAAEDSYFPKLFGEDSVLKKVEERGTVSGESLRDSLVSTESGGNPGIVDGAKDGREHVGLYQFGQPRLDDYNKANKTSWTTEDLKTMPPEEQEKLANWHFSDIGKAIKRNRLDKYVGKTIGGVKITLSGMYAMAHLGGISGLKRFLESNGKSNPKDLLGTSLALYAQKHAGKKIPEEWT